ncbi:MAG: 1-acyl-sn-glycerol-3-phosphate acyltransferase [Nanoarchaeota archaeon]|nr:1-acyl-sn-glycerol-3-phosphate acyltransferase [Nanoarchaeota archaeon]
MVYPIEKWIIPPIYKLWLRKVEGLENVPKHKPFIMAMNHASYYDALLLPSLIIPKIDKKIHALVNSYYWNKFLTRIFLNYHESIPVYVEKGDKSKKNNKKSFEKAFNYLKKNEIIMIFPEGKRSSDGKLRKAYTGVARLALNSKIPVLPIGIIGSNKVLPKGKFFPGFKRCEVKIGKPIYFNKYYNKKINERVLENITRIIMKNIAKLIYQRYNY